MNEPLGDPLILALDTSTQIGSVALLRGSQVILELNQPVKTHSEVLLPLVARVLEMADVGLSDLAAIACGAGPGSFTGLRIGMATAKGLCYASKRPLVLISSLRALAMNVPQSERTIVSIIDAKKQELFAGFYRHTTAKIPQAVGAEMVLRPPLLKKLLDERPGVLVGDGALATRDIMTGQEIFDGDHAVHARSIAWLALARFCKGESDDLATAAPTYLRASDAELNSNFCRYV